jgi:hypothetical protein
VVQPGYESCTPSWEGERDPQRLATLRDWRIKATPEEVANSLLGNWRDELIFVLAKNLALYGVYQQKIERCDQRIGIDLGDQWITACWMKVAR